MHAVKGTFDGEKVIVPQGALGLPPGEVIVVFPDGNQRSDARQAWIQAQEPAFSEVWNNDEDAAYDNL